MFRTLRARLAALVTVVTFGVSLLICVTLDFSLRFVLNREVDMFLSAELLEFSAILRDVGTLEQMSEKIRREIGARPRGDLGFRVVGKDGVVLLSSNPTQPGMKIAVPDRVSDTPVFGHELRPQGEGELRTCSAWVRGIGGADQLAQATYDLDDLEAALKRFEELCTIALVVSAIAAALGGQIVARRGLRPLESMSAEARGTDLANLGQRLSRTGAGDELDQLAGRFNEMLARLESQVGQLRQFTADAAHELRTPLAALRGSAEVTLSEARTTEELRTTLAESLEEYDRLTRIANDLLLLARADAGQLVMKREPVRLDSALVDVVDLFTPIADDRGITVRIATASTWVMGESDRLRQVLTNLLDNALKYTPDGGKISAALENNGSEAVLTIRDSGAGIAAEDLPHVFDRFYRADRARARSGGAGLGLTISHSVILAHQGQISIASTPGNGTTVTIRLATTTPPPATLSTDC